MSSGASPRRRRKQYERKSLSCTECTRRKLRCSKVIPCSACTERGNGNLCRRRETNRRPETSHRPPPSAGSPTRSHTESMESLARKHPRATTSITFEVDEPATEGVMGPQPRVPEFLTGRIVDGVSEDFAVTLEFLTLGRQRVLQLAGDTYASPETQFSTSPATHDVDPVVTEAQATFIFNYHEQNLTWTHNVVHLPTFKLQVKGLFQRHPPAHPCWPPLYYAMLSHSLYHIDPGIISEIGIIEDGPSALAKKAHEMSIDALFAAQYMGNHSLYAVQAICLLIYVGHNMGQSDLISVLLASGIRIAQCLGLHRLGASKSLPSEVRNDPNAIVPYLVDREVQCRAWWFLLRQDWLQIPFLNTYTIHASQFNTPMPKNCFDSFDAMVHDGEIVEHDVNVHTDCSYTAVLNKVCVLVWKTQDRMCTLGHPNKLEDGLRKLYEEVLRADAELRRIIQEMPAVFRDSSAVSSSVTLQQRQTLNLSNAHKFFTLHRHFQVISFKDPWYTYTKVSCLNVARRGLQAILSLPLDPSTWAARNLWTVNTHIVTAAVWIMFEQLFTGPDANAMFERDEMLDLVRRSIARLCEVQDRSQIARRGARLLQFLLDTEEATANGQRKRLEVSDIVTYVQRGSGDAAQSGGECFMLGMPSDTEWMSQGATTWEALIDAMGEIGDFGAPH